MDDELGSAETGTVNTKCLTTADATGEIAGAGATPLAIRHGNVLLGVIELKDTVKPGPRPSPSPAPSNGPVPARKW